MSFGKCFMINKLLDLDVKIESLLLHTLKRTDNQETLFIAYRSPRSVFTCLIKYYDTQNISFIKDNKILSNQDLLQSFSIDELERCESDFMYYVYLFGANLIPKNQWDLLSIEEKARLIGFEGYELRRDLKTLVNFYFSS